MTTSQKTSEENESNTQVAEEANVAKNFQDPPDTDPSGDSGEESGTIKPGAGSSKIPISSTAKEDHTKE